MIAVPGMDSPAWASGNGAQAGFSHTKGFAMKTILIALVLLCSAPALAQVSAQSHADHLAATGSFGHCSRRGGAYEGIGLSPSSPEDACRRACFWGKRRIREIGTSWCPVRRLWIAVVRYW